MAIDNGESGLSAREEINLSLAKTDLITVTQAVNLDTIETNSDASKVKTDFITITQAVDLDAIETNSNASKVKTDFITVTQAVDLDAIETNSNASKVKTDFITVTQAVNLDTIESTVATALQPANIVETITNGVTTNAPSENAVFDALALKEPLKGADDNYVTDAQLVVIGNTSGTNTGDNAVNSNYSGLVSNATHTGDVSGSTVLTIGAGKVTEAMQVLADNTTNDFSTTKHGYVPKGTNLGKFLKDDGTWATISGGGDALVSNPLSQFAATSSLQLKGVISDETGSGALVFADSPTLVTPALGTPASGVLTNATGLPEGGLSLTDITTNNASTTKHGFLKKLSNVAAEFMNGVGDWVNIATVTLTLTNKRVTPRTGTATSAAEPTINTDNVDYYSLTAQAADITSFTTNLSGTPTENQKLWIAITGTAARAITWGASFENGAVTLPTTTVTTTRLDVGFVWNTVTSKWRCMAQG